MTHRGPFQPLPCCDSVILCAVCCALCNVLSYTLFTKVCGMYRVVHDAVGCMRCTGLCMMPEAVHNVLG